MYNEDGARPSWCCFRGDVEMKFGTGVTAKRNFGSSRAKWGARYLKQQAKIGVGEYRW